MPGFTFELADDPDIPIALDAFIVTEYVIPFVKPVIV